MRTYGFIERAPTESTLRSWFFGAFDKLSSKSEFPAEFRSNPSQPDEQTHLSMTTTSITEMTKESWFEQSPKRVDRKFT
jgi:hypothetical protein